MIRDDLRKAFLREIDSLKAQANAYPDDGSMWAKPDGISNTGGNLLLHLAGNLRFFVGHHLGGIAYERDREFEFSGTGAPRDDVLIALQGAYDAVNQTLAGITDEQLAAPFPVEFAGGTLGTQLFLVHLLSHAAYHLGQIDYHRRLVTGQNVAVGALSIPRLFESF